MSFFTKNIVLLMVGQFICFNVCNSETPNPASGKKEETFSESLKETLSGYFFGRPPINGVEITEPPCNEHLQSMLTSYQLCGAVDKSILFDFGLTHATEDSVSNDSYRNLVLPWKRLDCKVEAEKHFIVKDLKPKKDANEALSEKDKLKFPLALPARIVFQFGPENPSSIGNFIFMFLCNADLNKPQEKAFSKINSLSFNTTARGFFGDQSGWLKNIELVFQIGCTYDMDAGFSRYQFQKYDENIDRETKALAGTINEYYFAFEGALGLFFQHPSNRFRTGIFWTNNNYFNTSKSSTILSNGSVKSKDAIKDYTEEYRDKVDALTFSMKKSHTTYSEFGALVEANFFQSMLSVGACAEKIYLNHPDIEKRHNLKTMCIAISPHMKFCLTKELGDDKNVLLNGKIALKNFMLPEADQYKVLGRALNVSLQLNF